ncbi:hypothetical protein C6P45_001445 [Maudiozyma exigua]|uniref:Uncharacterized protein n=1 Tax=Maudiozyma exigua TaxID=34358 RepID=A0A9P6W160_MAUEX|nr:hypothetical protein C6P45_001445 [Kazachstania exigua]
MLTNNLKRTIIRSRKRCDYLLRCTVTRSSYSTATKFNNQNNNEQIANLGEITDYLVKDGIPNLLIHNYNDKYISDTMKLRLFPTLSYIPVINGKVKVNASLNALRLLLTTFILNHDTKHFHIHSIQNISSKDRDNISANTYAYYKNSEKLYVKWATCTPHEKCQDISDRDIGIQAHHRTRDGSIGKNDTSRHESLLDYILSPSQEKFNSSNIEKEYNNLLLKKENENGEPITRVLQGIFLFEFNKDNRQIEVQTIEDIELIDYKKKVKQHSPNFAIC